MVHMCVGPYVDSDRPRFANYCLDPPLPTTEMTDLLCISCQLSHKRSVKLTVM